MTRSKASAAFRARRTAGRAPRRFRLLPLLVALAAHGAGCAPTEADPAPTPRPDQAAAELPPPGPDPKIRRAVAAAAATDLAALASELDRLDARVEQSAGAAKIEGRARLDSLRERWALTNDRLARADACDDASWGAAREELEKSRGELAASFERAREWMRVEVGP